ncbi:3'-5' exonuclease [Mycobacterium alsense]|uniref:3'-5' exonuclease n=1 Tax=Mycobacterium alsense TaxID=324058 RepID=A0AA41XR33_9MYCO|nr:3'-5' exonuclease [Mycobacterium alsense]MCV7379804.1 3'-5' exonuclease [Mycobacterium alsense]
MASAICASAWPWWCGTYIAVHLGAGNPSAARSAVGWVFELSWLAFLAVAFVGWVVPNSQRADSNSPTDVAERRPPLGVKPRRRYPAIPCARLTTSNTPFPAEQAIFTVVDLETTGLNPETDRIVEIGLVKFSADGRTIDEFATLVNNPGSSREAIGVHRILDSDLVGAPPIEDVLREAFSFISGTVLVAHNFAFEGGFLSVAAWRAGIRLPDAVGVCTLETCRRHLDGRAFGLPAMYKTATGEWAHHGHTALGDARAVKEVLLWLLRNAPSPLYFTQEPRVAAPSPVLDTCQISCRPVPLVRASMADLLASFPQSTRTRRGDPRAIQSYRTLLDQSVHDGRLTMQEASDLARLAMATGVTGTRLRQIHRQAWDTAFAEEKDRPWAALTPLRRREMYLLADALGLTDLASDVNAVIAACSEPEPPPEARYLRALRVAIVGEDPEIVALRERAESHGAKLAVHVTKTVQWLATTTPGSSDARHTSARKLGIPILDPSHASVRLSEAIREAERKASARQRELDEFAAARHQRETEADAYWRPVWRKSELVGDLGG